MSTTELKKGRSYYYTAGAEWVKVTYKHQTINGYLFEGEGKTEYLTKQSVQQHITEI